MSLKPKHASSLIPLTKAFSILRDDMIFSDINFNNKSILITGGAGFIGSNLAFYFQKNYPESKIVVFDCFRSETTLQNGNLKSLGHYKNLVGFNGEILCGNINDKNDLNLLSDYKFDYIFHHAAISDTRIYDQEIVMRTNVNSFYDLLKIAKDNDAVLVYASSAATYGSMPAPQLVGNENPENPYGFSKYMMDQIAYKYIKNNPNMTIVGLRFFNVYGSREYYKAKMSSMVIQLAHQILDGHAPRLFTGSENIFRDFIHIDDVIQANIKATDPKTSGIYNVGTGTARSFKDISTILQCELGVDLGVEYIPNPYTGYQMHTQADIVSCIDNLGFNPLISLEDGIKAYIPEIKNLHGTDFR